MKALINTLNLTINIHRDSPESTSHESTKRDGADLAEFLMAMSQMELFPDCDEEGDEAIAEPTEDTTPVVAGSPEAVALRLDQKLCMLAAHTTSLTTYAIGDSRNAGQQLSVREAYQRAVEGSTMVLVPTNSWLYQAISSGDAAPRHMVWVNYYTKSGNHGHTVYPSRQEAHDHANTSTAEVHQRCYAVYEVCNFREAIDMNFPGHMDSADDAPAMDLNTLHAERLQAKLCMRLTDNYREVGQAIDDSRLKDKQASVIDACRSVIDEDTKVLIPENSWVFRMMDTSDLYVSTFRHWVNYYVASDNYGATAYTSREEAREKSTDSSKSIVQVPFIELSVKLLRIQLRAMGVTFN